MKKSKLLEQCPECLEDTLDNETVGTGEGYITAYNCINCGYQETYP